MRGLKFGPLFGFTLLSLLGFVFFTACLVLIWIYSVEVNEFLSDKFNKTTLGEISQIFIETNLTFRKLRQHEDLHSAIIDQCFWIPCNIRSTSSI